MGWNPPKPPALKKVEPYLAWAVATQFSGHAAARRPSDRIPMLIELRPGSDIETLTKSGVVDVPGLYLSATERSPFCTGFVRRDRLADLASMPGVKRFEFALPISTGAIDPSPPPSMTAAAHHSIVIGIVDRGCAFLNAAFREAWVGPGRMKTRILSMWDQTAGARGPHWRRPAGAGYGRELDAATINGLIARVEGGETEEDIYRELDHLLDRHGQLLGQAHGTHVADTAAGLVDTRQPACSSKPSLVDAASAAQIVFVSIPNLGVDDSTGGSPSAYILDAARYILDRAGKDANVVINLSVGVQAGPHDGSALIGAALDDLLARRQGMAVVAAAGNGAAPARWNASGTLQGTAATATARTSLVWRLMPDDVTDSFVEIWARARPAKASSRGVQAHVEIVVQAPSGERSEAIKPGQQCDLTDARGQLICKVSFSKRSTCHLGEDSMVLISVAPNAGARGVAQPGRWVIDLVLKDGKQIVDFDAWIQRDEPPDPSSHSTVQSFFEDAAGGSVGVDEGSTLSSLCASRLVTVVGACRRVDREMSRYSAGPGKKGRAVVRDVDLLGAADESATAIGLFAAGVSSGQTTRMGGTSVAAPSATREFANRLSPGGGVAKTLSAGDVRKRVIDDLGVYQGSATTPPLSTPKKVVLPP